MYLTHKDLSKYYVFDVEANGLNPDKVWCVVVKNSATGDRWDFAEGALKDFKRFVEEAGDVFWVGHNALSYDVPVVNRLLGTSIPNDRVVDTLVLSYLYHPKMPGGHSLEAYGERFKFPKDMWDDFTQFSPGLLERCRVDVDLALKLFIVLTQKMRAVGFSEKSCEIEHKVRVIINKQQQNGFKFDEQAAHVLGARLRQTQASLEGGIRTLFPPELSPVGTYNRRRTKAGEDYATYQRHCEQYPKLEDNPDGTYTTFDWKEFNIGSPQQRLTKLLTLGFVPTKLTKSGNPSVDEDSLVEFSKEINNDQIKAIADWLVVSSRASMVDSWLDVMGSDGCIHGSVFSCGAASRRMTHAKPNTANVPGNEAKYGEDVRSLWTARLNRVLVGADAKSAQMRCFAHYLPKPEDGKRFYTDGHDPHQENADLIGIKRKPIKNVFYANMFGAWPKKLALTAGFTGPQAEANEYGEWIRAELYRVTPGLEASTKDAQAEARSTSEGWMVCLDGGYVRCPSEHAALNYKIQPAEAVLMKQGLIYADEWATKEGFDYLKVGDIHDEWQNDLEPRQAQDFGNLCVKALRASGETLNLRVPFDGDFKIGRTWAETH
jgi:DNA polymerase I-like protein with 3'-5' exonuclease and polymerase domains